MTTISRTPTPSSATRRARIWRGCCRYRTPDRRMGKWLKGWGAQGAGLDSNWPSRKVASRPSPLMPGGMSCGAGWNGGTFSGGQRTGELGLGCSASDEDWHAGRTACRPNENELNPNLAERKAASQTMRNVG